MLNRVILSGRLVKDPEIRFTGGGMPVANFTLAITRRFDKEKKADFFNCVAWNKLADTMAHYCFKGSRINVEGRLQSRQYENQEGKNVTVVEVVVENVEFLDSKKENNNSDVQNQAGWVPQTFDSVKSNMSQSPSAMIDLDSPFDIDDDDIQF